MRLLAPLLLLAISPVLGSCDPAVEAQDREPGGESADPATAGARLDHRFRLEDWSAADLSYAGGADSFKDSRAICARYLDMEPPAPDWPLLARVNDLAGCDSFNLANHIGGPPDYERARHCALIERETMGRDREGSGIESRPTLEGPGLLAVLYANGQGVPRNLPVAIHMVCEMNGAPFEMDQRIARLEEMRRTGWQGSDFTPCDDMTSGYGASACASYSARLGAAERDARFRQVASGWAVDRREALLALRDAFDAYAQQANSMNNYGAGSGWAAMAQISGANAASRDFAERLLAVIARQTPPPLPEPVEGDIADGGVAERAGTVSEAEWQAFLADVSPDDRPQYQEHRAATIAARRAFEPKLVAFMRLVRPDLSAHDVRVLFRDL